jgi:hypothetical protein
LIRTGSILLPLLSTPSRYVIFCGTTTYLEEVDNSERQKIENLIEIGPNQNSSQVHPEYLLHVAIENKPINTVAKLILSYLAD